MPGGAVMCALFDILLYGAMAMGLLGLPVLLLVMAWAWLTEP
jgi:hypothetical protein